MKKIDTNGTVLQEAERNLIFQWRSLQNAVFEIGIQDKLPIHARINILGFLQRKPVSLYPLTSEEIYILEWIKKISYGKIILVVKQGVPQLAETSSFANLRFDKLSSDIEFEG